MSTFDVSRRDKLIGYWNPLRKDYGDCHLLEISPPMSGHDDGWVEVSIGDFQRTIRFNRADFFNDNNVLILLEMLVKALVAVFSRPKEKDTASIRSSFHALLIELNPCPDHRTVGSRFPTFKEQIEKFEERSAQNPIKSIKEGDMGMEGINSFWKNLDKRYDKCLFTGLTVRELSKDSSLVLSIYSKRKEITLPKNMFVRNRDVESFFMKLINGLRFVFAAFAGNDDSFRDRIITRLGHFQDMLNGVAISPLSPMYRKQLLNDFVEEMVNEIRPGTYETPCAPTMEEREEVDVRKAPPVLPATVSIQSENPITPGANLLDVNHDYAVTYAWQSVSKRDYPQTVVIVFPKGKYISSKRVAESFAECINNAHATGFSSDDIVIFLTSFIRQDQGTPANHVPITKFAPNMLQIDRPIHSAISIGREAKCLGLFKMVEEWRDNWLNAEKDPAAFDIKDCGRILPTKKMQELAAEFKSGQVGPEFDDRKILAKMGVAG